MSTVKDFRIERGLDRSKGTVVLGTVGLMITGLNSLFVTSSEALVKPLLSGIAACDLLALEGILNSSFTRDDAF